MIRHLVLIRFKDGTTEEQADELVEGLRGLAFTIDEIAGYEVGKDLGIGTGRHDLGIAALFLSEEDFTAYLNHPEHTKLVDTVLSPITADVARVQFRV